jgi:hypothetical protein
MTIGVGVVATLVPFNEPVNKLIPNSFVPSVEESAVIVTLNTARLLVTVIEPVLPPTISELVVLPVVFQYNVVPSGTLLVTTVY